MPVSEGTAIYDYSYKDTSGIKRKVVVDNVVVGEIQAAHDDKGKVRFDLIPTEAEEALAGVLSYGATKYAERNWEQGMDYSRLYGSARRHLAEWYKGIDIDPESNLHHLHHALTNIAFLITYIEREVGVDDRREH